MHENTISSTSVQIQESGESFSLDQQSILSWSLFISIHIPLALLMRESVLISTIHAIIIFGIGLIAVTRWPKDDLRHLWIVGYIVGAEVLWRATGASRIIASEQARYVSILIIIIMMIRRRNDKHFPILPIIYILMLIPSLLAYIGTDLPFFKLRQWALGTLLGPIATTVYAVYFSGLELNAKNLWKLGIFAVAPIIGSATIGAYNVITLGESINFIGASNDIAAGFGPNQVSNTLSMGIVLCWLLFFQPGVRNWLKVFVVLIAIGLTAQMLLTFSRGGIWTTGITIVATIPFLLMSRRHRLQSILLIPIVILVLAYLILPRLDKLTDGALSTRIVDPNSTFRAELAQSEIQVWLDNPVLGVGPGLAREMVSDYGLVNKVFQAHVEYTRVLAEHGILGFFAMLILIVGIITNFLRAKSMDSRIWIVACGLFFFAYIGQSAFRTAAPSLMYGLTWAHLFVSPEPEPEPEPEL